MKKLQKIFLIAVTLMAFNPLAVMAAHNGYPDGHECHDPVNAQKALECGVDSTQSNPSQSLSLTETIGNVIQTLLFLIGIISVIMIIIGGLMFVVSSGDSNNAKRARETIIYAIIGLVVSLLAYGIVTFVVDRLA